MKKIFLCFTMIFVLVLVSCGSSKDYGTKVTYDECKMDLENTDYADSNVFTMNMEMSITISGSSMSSDIKMVVDKTNQRLEFTSESFGYNIDMYLIKNTIDPEAEDQRESFNLYYSSGTTCYYTTIYDSFANIYGSYFEDSTETGYEVDYSDFGGDIYVDEIDEDSKIYTLKFDMEEFGETFDCLCQMEMDNNLLTSFDMKISGKVEGTKMTTKIETDIDYVAKFSTVDFSKFVKNDLYVSSMLSDL